MRHVESLVCDLNRAGVGQGDVVAIVLPNGADMALACLAAASGAVAAPLNPASRTAEFEFYLSDLRPKALIVQRNLGSPARPVAAALGATVLELSPRAGDDNGLLALSGGLGSRESGLGTRESGGTRGSGFQTGFVDGFEPALLLHTSGTTSRPKLVRLTQSNLCAAADNTRTSLGLCAEDRCLNVMPLFHVHGLIGALLSSLSAGGSVVCSPGFDARQFFNWLDDFQPTWYTAVPAMHRALLPHASSHSSVLSRRALRASRASFTGSSVTTFQAKGWRLS